MKINRNFLCEEHRKGLKRNMNTVSTTCRIASASSLQLYVHNSEVPFTPKKKNNYYYMKQHDDLKITMQSTRSLTKLGQTIWLHLYEIVEHPKLIYSVKEKKREKIKEKKRKRKKSGCFKGRGGVYCKRVWEFALDNDNVLYLGRCFSDSGTCICPNSVHVPLGFVRFFEFMYYIKISRKYIKIS